MLIGKVGNLPIKDTNLRITGKRYMTLNSVAKTALLVTLAGYLEKDDILVKDLKYYKKNKLEDFLSYVLNIKRAAPKNFNLNIKFDEKNIEKPKSGDKNNYSCLISFSGGIDSTAGILYALDKGIKVTPVWIGFGQKNEEKELGVMKKICKKLKLKPLIIKIDLKEYVDKGWSRWKLGMVPARNYLFIALVSTIANLSSKKNIKIFLCAHKEEITPVNTDKSLKFYKTSNKIFSDFYSKKIEVTSPFFKVTKPELVSYWIKNWESKYGISPKETVSCFFGNSCGVCKACINRSIAFLCAGLPMDKLKVNPFSDKNKTLEEGYIYRFDELEKERKLDFLYAMNINFKYLPLKIKKFIKPRINKNRKDILKRIEKIRKIEKI